MAEKTHWLQNPNKNYLGHWDLPGGKDLILTIKSAKWEKVENPVTHKEDACRVVRFEEEYKPLICNQTNAQSIIKATGVKFMEDSCGSKIQLYVDVVMNQKEKEEVDCIRIRREAPIVMKEVLTDGHEKWEKACKKVKAGETTIEDIRKHYIISDEDFNEMLK